MGRNVAALTFTNKAAREMAGRVKTLVDPGLAKGLSISTFHALGARFLREEAAHAGLKKQFSILDADDALGIIQELLATTDRARLRQAQTIISLWKNALLGPGEAARAAATPAEVEAAGIYRSYAATLAAYQAVDFDDLIRIPAQVLAANEEVRTRWQNRVRYLLVDEYQDTNPCQYRLVRWLTGARAMFTVVGDDDQAIYAWRGATVENLAMLAKDYPGIKIIKLEQNYRSVQRVLAAANRVIAQNPKLFEKKLWSELGAGEPITVSAMNSEEQEAENLAMKISASRFERRAKWKDFAILYRGNHQARALEQALRDLNIPYTVSGGQSFFDKAEVRDILAYLRLIANGDDDPAFIRAATTPKRGIGQGTLQALGQYAAAREISLLAAVDETGLASRLPPRQLEPLRGFTEFIRRIQWRAGRGAANAAQAASSEPAGAILDDLLGAIQYERHLYDTLDEKQARGRWQNVLELTDWLKHKAEEDGMTLFDLTQHVALITLLERGEDNEPDAVKLSTLHAAKGLEYPHVFLAGVEEGLLPHLGKDGEDAGGPGNAAEALATRIQEERRLMYVGITRAQRSLHLSWCKQRRRARETLTREPSRFIEEMGLGEPGLPEDETTKTLTPRERLDMLQAMLKKA
jgi:ATP-dependent DNA helicase Rep